MKKLNKKGFTLIELLAVIVILAVVLGIAIPAVSKYITQSRKNGYVDNLLQFIDAARKGATLGDEFELPVDEGSKTVITFEQLESSLEKGGKTSPYGNPWNLNNSFVVIQNTGSSDLPKYTYYVTATDGKYATGTSGESKAEIIAENDLKASHVVRMDGGGLDPKNFEMPD
ncbi:MAG: type II secretion system protein [bacterium]|nr:type II secretion system protein [bacterium]